MNSNINNEAHPFEEAPLVAQIYISVRGLVEFILRSGDINSGSGGTSSPEVMLEGANIHRMIQRRMGTNYHAEYFLSQTFKRGEYTINVDGRADGIIIPNIWEEYIGKRGKVLDGIELLPLDLSGKCGEESEETELNTQLVNPYKNLSEAYDFPEEFHKHLIIVDEIKSTYKDLDKIKEPNPVHLAQAMCYAYIYSLQYELPYIGVRMTYVNIESHETRYFNYEYTYSEIEKFFVSVMKKYIKFTDFEVNWRRVRNYSIEGINFPFEYRSGQKELVAQVYRSIENKERLFVMAPTGVGKTLANMYPSLKAIGNGKADKIFYLTAKTITRTVAADCLNLLRQQALKLKSVTLTAKEKICACEKVECTPENCPYAKGHFDRINDALLDMLMNKDEFSRDTIMEYANKHMVCPFEYSLDLSLFADTIICDYNYVFDPNVYLKRFFAEGNSGKYLFLIDEAHNLVDRAMSMYSARLVKEHFLEIKRLVKDVDRKLARRLESCNRYLLSLKRDCEDVLVVDSFEELVAHLLRLQSSFEKFFDDNEHFKEKDEVLELYFEVRHFLNIYENMRDEDYVFYCEIEDNSDFAIHLMCANPAQFVKKCTDKAVATVYFSATMLPIDYYRKMFGAVSSDPAVYAKSIFNPDNRLLVVGRDVTSKYTRRNDAEYDRMAEYISEISKSKPGNYIAFFPSFAMLNRVMEMYVNRYYDDQVQELVVQNSMMTEADREEFISKFTDQGDNIPALGFCVLGGIFSEGIDLKNDALIGAIIIGTGLPMVCPRRQLLKGAYEDMGLDGFAYAYRYPGMNKALQAAGRVIRTIDDRGVVALLDERFLNREYQTLFPREWSNYKTCNINDISEYLEEFWK